MQRDTQICLLLVTSRCETHGIDPVFMRGADGSTRPNVAICLTAPEHARDGGKAARPGITRSYAAHAVRTLRPTGLTGGAMVRRASTPRRPGQRPLPPPRQPLDPPPPPR